MHVAHLDQLLSDIDHLIMNASEHTRSGADRNKSLEEAERLLALLFEEIHKEKNGLDLLQRQRYLLRHRVHTFAWYFVKDLCEHSPAGDLQTVE